MLLVIDIGNTNIVLGVFEGEKLRATWRVASGIHRMADEYGIMGLALLRHNGIDPAEIKEAILCSVVPPLIATFEDCCKRYFNVTPLVVGAGIKTGVRIAMDNPREVGADRVVNAAAAHYLYGGPVIVIDFGTATTFDVVSKDGDYIGGAIAPGIMIAAEALYMRTAKLPRVEISRPKQAIGKNTIAAIQSGLVLGYIGLIEGLVTQLRKEVGSKAKVVATGGLAQVIGKETPVIQEVNPDLTLVGLRLIYEMNRA